MVNSSLLGWSQKFGRKQSLAVLLFLAAFLLLDRAVAWGLERALLASKFRYSELYRGNAANDILIFGNSRGVNGFFSPDMSRDLGARTLNLSFNGLSMGMSELLLLDYLEKNPAPKLIILEVTNLHNEGLNVCRHRFTGHKAKLSQAAKGMEFWWSRRASSGLR